MTATSQSHLLAPDSSSFRIAAHLSARPYRTTVYLRHWMEKRETARLQWRLLRQSINFAQLSAQESCCFKKQCNSITPKLGCAQDKTAQLPKRGYELRKRDLSNAGQAQDSSLYSGGWLLGLCLLILGSHADRCSSSECWLTNVRKVAADGS